MTHTKIRRALSFGTLFAIGALTFGLLYYFKAVKYLDIYLAVTYIVYFVGIAFLCNASYCKQKERLTTARICTLLAVLLVAASIVMLICGFVYGKIDFINF